MRRISVVIDGTKNCTVCHKRYPVCDFSPDKRQANGLQSCCKWCRHEYMKKRLANPEIKNVFYAQRKAKRRSNPELFMYTEAKKRAKARKLPFSISPEHIVVPACCPVFGVPLVVADGAGKNFSPSIDAIIPSLGYVPGNVQVISNLANRMKNNATREQLVAFAKWVLSESAEGFNEQRAQLKAVA